MSLQDCLVSMYLNAELDRYADALIEIAVRNGPRWDHDPIECANWLREHDVWDSASHDYITAARALGIL